jgi:hypothetical protein
MSKFDDILGKALTEEDRALLASHGEPGYLTQAFGIFRGRMAWVMWVVNVAGGVAFAGGLYAAWHVFAAVDVLAAVKWGVGSLFLFQVTTLCKSFMGNHMETNRVLRELKRVELQLSMLRDQAGPGR